MSKMAFIIAARRRLLYIPPLLLPLLISIHLYHSLYRLNMSDSFFNQSLSPPQQTASLKSRKTRAAPPPPPPARSNANYQCLCCFFFLLWKFSFSTTHNNVRVLHHLPNDQSSTTTVPNNNDSKHESFSGDGGAILLWQYNDDYCIIQCYQQQDELEDILHPIQVLLIMGLQLQQHIHYWWCRQL